MSPDQKTGKDAHHTRPRPATKARDTLASCQVDIAWGKLSGRPSALLSPLSSYQSGAGNSALARITKCRAQAHQFSARRRLNCHWMSPDQKRTQTRKCMLKIGSAVCAQALRETPNPQSIPHGRYENLFHLETYVCGSLSNETSGENPTKNESSGDIQWQLSRRHALS